VLTAAHAVRQEDETGMVGGERRVEKEEEEEEEV
jgi:hypothetical protein